MAKVNKFSGSQEDKENYSGDLEKEKKFIISSRVNATRELFVGQRYFRFLPYEIKKTCESGFDIGQDIIGHKDFIQQSDYFNYKEV